MNTKIIVFPTYKRAIYEWLRLRDMYPDCWIDTSRNPDISLTSKMGVKYLFIPENQPDKLRGVHTDIIHFDEFITEITSSHKESEDNNMADEETKKPLQIVEYPHINNDRLLSNSFFKPEAYKLVFNELIKCNMFKGIYDAKHGNTDFMYGILAVMEYIAVNVSEDCYENFTAEFTKNMVNSKFKANHKEGEDE